MRRRRRGRMNFDLNLDSLMDVVTNVVGVMLFVVVFAVIEARSTTVPLGTPLLAKPRAGQRRMFFVCSNGSIRPLGWDRVADDVIARSGKLTFARVPKFVSDFNANAPQDQHFRYRLDWETDTSNPYRSTRKVFLISEETSPPVARDPDDEARAFADQLATADPDTEWLSFLVDGESIEVFRAAREVAASRGFSVGWDPNHLEFPHRECLLGCGGGSRSGGLGLGHQ
jgi:hypothetical protein